MEFIHPDFGYGDTMNLRQNDIWTMLYDHITKIPKYERLKNIILDLAREKELIGKKKKLAWVAESDKLPN